MNIDENSSIKELVDFLLEKFIDRSFFCKDTVTDNKLSKFLELDKTMISKWKNNKAKISERILNKIKKKFDLTEEEFSIIKEINDRNWKLEKSKRKHLMQFNQGFSIYIEEDQIKDFDKVLQRQLYIVPVYHTSEIKPKEGKYIRWICPVSYVLEINKILKTINFQTGDLVGIIVSFPEYRNGIYLIRFEVDKKEVTRLMWVTGLGENGEVIDNLLENRVSYYRVQEDLQSSYLIIKKSGIKIIGKLINRLSNYFSL
jgi:transcriptional regulator with XRE-family HTH domain